jgi:Zinc finger, C2H2 type
LNFRVGRAAERRQHRRDKVGKQRGCHQLFESRQQLQNHAAAHKQRCLPCAACGVMCHSKSSLAQHLKQHEQPPRDDSCPHCGKQIKYLHNLRAHVAKHESGAAGMLKCLHFRCQRSFGSAWELRNHVLGHQGDVESQHAVFSVSRPFACDSPGCAYAAKFKSALNNHKHKMHSAGWFASHLCDKTFKNKLYLRLHIARHLKNADNPRLSCIASKTPLLKDESEQLVVD